MPDLSPLNFEYIEAIQTYGRYCCPAVTPQLLSYQESDRVSSKKIQFVLDWYFNMNCNKNEISGCVAFIMVRNTASMIHM